MFTWLLFGVLLPFPLLAQSLAPLQHPDGRWGYAKPGTQKFKIAPQFIYASAFAGNIARVQTAAGFQLIDEKGKTLLPTPYDSLGWTSNGWKAWHGLFGAKRQGQWQLVNQAGEVATWLPADARALVPQTTHLLGVLRERWELYTPQGKRLPFALDSLVQLPNGHLWIWQDLVGGLLDAQGTELLPLQHRSYTLEGATLHATAYPALERFQTQTQQRTTFYADSLIAADSAGVHWWVQRGTYWALYTENQPITPFLLEKVAPLRGHVSLVRQQERWGLLRSDGTWAQPPQYERMEQDKNGLFRAKKRLLEPAWHYFTPNGHSHALPPSVTWIADAPDASGLYLAKQQGKFGYLDQHFAWHIAPQYEHAQPFHYGFAAVRSEGFAGIINEAGQWVIRPVVDSLWVYAPHAFAFRDRGISGALDATGIERFVSDTATHYTPLGQGLQSFAHGRRGFINAYGEQILLPLYDSIALHDAHYLKVWQSGTLFYAPQYERAPTPAQPCHGFTLLGELRDDLVPVRDVAGRVGFLDAFCRLRLSTRYEAALPFSEGLAGVQLGGKWGYLNAQDELVIQPRYERVSPFVDGWAVAWQAGRCGLLNTEGKWAVRNEYDEIVHTAQGNWLLRKDGQWGLVSRETGAVLFPKYTHIEDTPTNAVVVQRTDRWGIDRRDGVHLRFAEYAGAEHLTGYFFLLVQPAAVRQLSLR